jgi:lipopolysaccharide transport system ATP-binding protein
MYVRLAFAVAAHLEAEILVVDEVLAVGDTRFQKKCLTKMSAAGHEGRTVLFVSHNMGTIARLCPRAMMLEGGQLVNDGPANEVVSSYLHGGTGTTAMREFETPVGRDVARLRGARVRTADGSIAQVVDVRQSVSIEIEYDVLRPAQLLPQLHLTNEEGVHVCSLHDVDPTWRGRERPVGRWTSTVTIPANFLSEGMIFVRVTLLTLNPPSTQFARNEVVAFRIVDSGDGDSARGDWTGSMEGIIRPMLPWTNEMTAADDPSAKPGRVARG